MIAISALFIYKMEVAVVLDAMKAYEHFDVLNDMRWIKKPSGQDDIDDDHLQEENDDTVSLIPA